MERLQILGLTLWFQNVAFFMVDRKRSWDKASENKTGFSVSQEKRTILKSESYNQGAGESF